MTDHYWISHPWDAGPYIEVSEEDYVRAERDQGFHNTMGRPQEPATASFHGPDGIHGTTLTPTYLIALPRDFTAGQHYFDHAGRPVSLIKWGTLYEDGPGRTLRNDMLAGRQLSLRTMYLGYVDPLCDARLYGTALVTEEPYAQHKHIEEIERYDCAAAAYVGHLRNLAIRSNHRFPRATS